jgi:hypothetical protein
MHRCMARHARSASARSRGLVFVNTVSSTMRRPLVMEVGDPGLRPPEVEAQLTEPASELAGERL